MKIVLAPDKFKGCLSSPKVSSIMKQAFQDVLPGSEIVSVPLADGGEGTVDAIVSALGGEKLKVRVTGPLGKYVEAEFGLCNSGKSAVMEMASASGMALLAKEELNPLLASSYGTGELIRAAMRVGVEEITLGIGGSATVDGGAGMAQALGYRLLDENGHDLPPGAGALDKLASIDASGVDRRLFQIRIHAACDVTNPLTGPDGAAAVYAPQKGATPEMVGILEANLKRLSELWIRNRMLDPVSCPGDGAAGGLGGGLRAFCSAKLCPGAALVMKAVRFREKLFDADLVVTGEGCTDAQTESGKLCSEVARVAHEEGVPVLLLSGALRGELERFNGIFDFAFSIASGRPSLEEAIASAPEDIRFTVLNVARLLRKGFHP